MMSKLRLFLLLSGIVFLSTCITPLTDITTSSGLRLVVDGFITDEPGPHNVQISFFDPIDPNIRLTRGLPNPQVTITNQNTGEVIELRRNPFLQKRYPPVLPPPPPDCLYTPFFDEGLTPFQTPSSFRGVVGDSYTLEVTLRDGRRYRSTPQELLPNPGIDTLGLRFVTFPGDEIDRPESGVEISVAFEDPPENNFYFWRLNGIYRINTPDFREPGLRDCPCQYDISDGGVDQCWIVETNLTGNETAFSDGETSESRITVPVGIVVDDGLRFNDRLTVSDEQQYYVDVEQYAMSEEAFLYNDRIKILREINGEVFDPPPLTVLGNISNVEDEDDRLIGFFGAYSIRRKDTFIPRGILEFRQTERIVCGDCRTRAGAQVETPEPYR